MSNLVLRTAIDTYGHTKALKDGTAKSSRFEMEHIDVSPVTSLFRRMVQAHWRLSHQPYGGGQGRSAANASLAGCRAFHPLQHRQAPLLRVAALGCCRKPGGPVLVAMAELVGDDPLPYGFESARKTLETFVGFNVDQQVIPQWVDPEEIFAPTTIGLS
jgi:hypothetical protein